MRQLVVFHVCRGEIFHRLDAFIAGVFDTIEAFFEFPTPLLFRQLCYSL